MSAVCRDATPESSSQAGHTHVKMSLSDDAITHRHRQTDIDTQDSQKDANLRTRTLDKPCMVKQEHDTDTQEGRATDKKSDGTHLGGSHTMPARAAKMLTALGCRVSLSEWRFVAKLPSLQQIITADPRFPSPQSPDKAKTMSTPCRQCIPYYKPDT